MSDIIKMTVATDKIWNIKLDGLFKTNLAKRLAVEDELSSNAIDNIFQNAVDILSDCPNPTNPSDTSNTGIVIGRVQSGKTSNFISLAALAFDNGYQICIVLGGNKNNLLDQNQKRIECYLRVDITQIAILSTKNNKSLVNSEKIKDFLKNGRKVVIIGLKIPKHINKIIEVINSDPYLKSVYTLIIDDEGDQATLNTGIMTKSVSATYKAACDLKNILEHHCFVSVTATPQANILIDVCDILSPDFGKLVYPGEDYCGLSEFHGEKQDIFVKNIPDDEPSLLDEDCIPTTLYKALAVFYIGGAIRKYRGDQRAHSMLIHPSQKKYDHKVVLDKVDSIITKWKNLAEMILNGKNDISYQSKLKTHLLEAYESFKNDGVLVPSFSELEKVALKCIMECSKSHLCNSDEDASENAKLYQYNIFVGGNMVERGITFKGLAVTYIIRRAKGISNIDNTEQRARWFGYKREYLDVCRIFASKDIKRDFSHILEHEEELWDSIERAQEDNTPFKEIPRLFKLSNTAKLRLTRQNVAKSERLSYSEWSKQSFFLFDKGYCESNKCLFEQLLLENEDKIVTIRYTDINTHKLLKDIPYNWLLNNLIKKLYFPTKGRTNADFFALLQMAFEDMKETPLIDVMWVRHASGEKRTIYEDGSINQLFQGRNPNTSADNYYPGDYKMADERPNVMQLQVHYLKPSNPEYADMDYWSPTVALYIPKEMITNLAQYVTREKR